MHNVVEVDIVDLDTIAIVGSNVNLVLRWINGHIEVVALTVEVNNRIALEYLGEGKDSRFLGKFLLNLLAGVGAFDKLQRLADLILDP